MLNEPNHPLDDITLTGSIRRKDNRLKTMYLMFFPAWLTHSPLSKCGRRGFPSSVAENHVRENLDLVVLCRESTGCFTEISFDFGGYDELRFIADDRKRYT